MKVLFAASEAHPLIKTGGLADVAGSLPAELQRLGVDMRLVLPAYRQVTARAGELRKRAELAVPGVAQPVRILEGRFADTAVGLLLVDAPQLYDRGGGPYGGPDGVDWPDNALRFTAFARAVVAIAQGSAIPEWRPDLVHANDWQTGLVPALLARATQRPATVFTIHNLAYQGMFDWATFGTLGLPPDLWQMNALEFHNHVSFIKGGLVFADWVNTVSPTYAREICTPEFGYGLEGLLKQRADRLVGILNGADYGVWSPARDEHIAQPYEVNDMAGKAVDKIALQREFGLPESAQVALVGHVGRLVEQKGIDLLLDALPALLKHPMQLVVLGTGDPSIMRRLTAMAARYPEKVSVRIDYDEVLAHRIEAGADIFVMPSRFEPCGLNQIYSLRYGTVPVVRATGGLADTVVDATPAALADDTATGFVFGPPTSAALAAAVERALAAYRDPEIWAGLVAAAMRQDFSWRRSAASYLELYRRALR